MLHLSQSGVSTLRSLWHVRSFPNTCHFLNHCKPPLPISGPQRLKGDIITTDIAITLVCVCCWHTLVDRCQMRLPTSTLRWAEAGNYRCIVFHPYLNDIFMPCWLVEINQINFGLIWTVTFLSSVFCNNCSVFLSIILYKYTNIINQLTFNSKII